MNIPVKASYGSLHLILSISQKRCSSALGKTLWLLSALIGSEWASINFEVIRKPMVTSHASLNYIANSCSTIFNLDIVKIWTLNVDNLQKNSLVQLSSGLELFQHEFHNSQAYIFLNSFGKNTNTYFNTCLFNCIANKLPALSTWWPHAEFVCFFFEEQSFQITILTIIWITTVFSALF